MTKIHHTALSILSLFLVISAASADNTDDIHVRVRIVTGTGGRRRHPKGALGLSFVQQSDLEKANGGYDHGEANIYAVNAKKEKKVKDRKDKNKKEKVKKATLSPYGDDANSSYSDDLFHVAVPGSNQVPKKNSKCNGYYNSSDDCVEVTRDDDSYHDSGSKEKCQNYDNFGNCHDDNGYDMDCEYYDANHKCIMVIDGKPVKSTEADKFSRDPSSAPLAESTISPTTNDDVLTGGEHDDLFSTPRQPIPAPGSGNETSRIASPIHVQTGVPHVHDDVLTGNNDDLFTRPPQPQPARGPSSGISNRPSLIWHKSTPTRTPTIDDDIFTGINDDIFVNLPQTLPIPSPNGVTLTRLPTRNHSSPPLPADSNNGKVPTEPPNNSMDYSVVPTVSPKQRNQDAGK